MVESLALSDANIVCGASPDDYLCLEQKKSGMQRAADVVAKTLIVAGSAVFLGSITQGLFQGSMAHAGGAQTMQDFYTTSAETLATCARYGLGSIVLGCGLSQAALN